jgi:formate hydrogenlyase subunit 3/multisubunit Na+/H+ antiporter MnhD subunit
MQLEHQASQAVQLLTPQQSSLALLPVWVLLTPLLGAVLVLLFRRHQWLKNLVVLASTTAALGFLLLMYQPVVSGIELGGRLYKGVYCSFPFIYPFQATFKIDPAGLLLAGITAFLWITSSLHALSYMTIEEHRTRYEFFVLLSLVANLGVLLAGDLLTLFVFFEGMIIFPYALIAHKEDKPSLEGANFYLYLGVFSSLCLLFAMFLLYYFVGSLRLEPMAELINARFPGRLRYVLAALMIFGFGGKAGVFFEHFWLPKAHPVAPSPASALLSGAMIAAGAYGIFRTVNMLFIPQQGELILQWLTSQHLGYFLIWLGVLTMFLGALNALISANSKRLLAYSSISQMGYIILGIGCAAYMGMDGAMGLAGALYHIVNHALFKSTLFLAVGAVYFRTHELNMYKLGGLWRRMPVTCVTMFIAVCAISGIPGFNGFASKTLLHHAIWEAYEHSFQLSPTGRPDFFLRIAEILFIITAGGTFAYNMKLWFFNFGGKASPKSEHATPAPWPMKLSLILGSAAIIFLGLYPNWLLEKIIGPALVYFNYDPNSHAYHLLYNVHAATGVRSIIPILYDPLSRAVVHSSEVVHNLLGSGDSLLLGTATCILGLKFAWFRLEVPAWLSVEFYCRRLFNGFVYFCRNPFSTLMRGVDRLIAVTLVDSWQSPTAVSRWTETMDTEMTKAAEHMMDGLLSSGRVTSAAETMDTEMTKAAEHMMDGLLSSGKVTSAAETMDTEMTKAAEQVVHHWLGPITLIRWVESLDFVYDRAVDSMIFAHSITNLLEKVKRDLGIKPIFPIKDIKYNTHHQEGGLIGKIRLALEGTTIVQIIRPVWNKLKQHRPISHLRNRVSRFDLEVYNSFVDRLLFGIPATESSERRETAFNRLCQYLSGIHTGDISTYISWIVIILAIITTTLVGKLYIKSTMHVIILITVLIVLTFLALMVFQERKKGEEEKEKEDQTKHDA